MEYEKLLEQLISLHPEQADEILATFHRRGDFSGNESADIYNIILLKEMSKLFSLNSYSHHEHSNMPQKQSVVEDACASEEVSEFIDLNFLRHNLIWNALSDSIYLLHFFSLKKTLIISVR